MREFSEKEDKKIGTHCKNNIQKLYSHVYDFRTKQSGGGVMTLGFLNYRECIHYTHCSTHISHLLISRKLKTSSKKELQQMQKTVSDYIMT